MAISPGSIPRRRAPGLPRGKRCWISVETGDLAAVVVVDHAALVVEEAVADQLAALAGGKDGWGTTLRSSPPDSAAVPDMGASMSSPIDAGAGAFARGLMRSSSLWSPQPRTEMHAIIHSLTIAAVYNARPWPRAQKGAPKQLLPPRHGARLDLR